MVASHGSDVTEVDMPNVKVGFKEIQIDTSPRNRRLRMPKIKAQKPLPPCPACADAKRQVSRFTPEFAKRRNMLKKSKGADGRRHEHFTGRAR